jgi:hypothetical protein
MPEWQPPKEAAAIGAFGMVIIVILSCQFKTRGFLNILLETVLMTAMFMRV